jgi:DNA-directed RNA polymerase subunit RPC12/RpoP
MPATTSDQNPACLICGAPLEYLDKEEEMTCSICGKNFLSNAKCTKGHFVCDECHASPSFSVIRYVCLHTASTDPFVIADEIMHSDTVHMHGPEHHIIVGAALLAAYKNAGGELDLPTALISMEHRGKMLPGGFCGLAGTCGAAVSTGMFLSIALKTNPLSGKNWGLGNLLTGECLIKIGSIGGPRCCKRDTYIAMQTTVEFVAKHLGINMTMPEKIVCEYSGRNQECLLEECPFHPMNA